MIVSADQRSELFQLLGDCFVLSAITGAPAVVCDHRINSDRTDQAYLTIDRLLDERPHNILGVEWRWAGSQMRNAESWAGQLRVIGCQWPPGRHWQISAGPETSRPRKRSPGPKPKT